jgi:hypothetical protein
MANSNGWGDGAANNAIGWGQGANNAIAWGDSHAKSWAGATDIVGLTTDPDAQAFITAAAITDPTQQAAIDNLVKGLKSDNIWTKMKAIYPFVGGTASTHKWNLKDPRDLDAAFRLVFNGGWTHSSNGATPNGTNGYADTKLIPSSVLSLNSSHVSGYTRTNTSVLAPLLSSENATTYNDGIFIWPKYTGNLYSVRVNDINSDSATAVANTQGMHLATRTASNVKKYIYNTTQILSATTVSSALNVSSIYIGASRNNANYSTHQMAFSSIGDGLTDTEASNLYTRVQAFQTALSRQV